MVKCFLLLIILCLINSDNAYSQSQIYKNTSPTIDGQIADSEWSDAVVFDKFYTFIPNEEIKNRDSTLVLVKQTDDALYFAFKYWPKGQVIRQSLTRDRSTAEENEFFILLDLENKGQNGYIFVFSFLDNQRDMMVYNQRNSSSEWDWKWEVKNTVFREPTDTEPGYIETEVKIPVDKLQNKNSKQIGINLQLFAYKPDGNYYYYSNVPDSELLSLKNMYKFDLKVPFKETLNLNFNVQPFVVADKFNDSTAGARFGGDFNVSLDKHTFKGTVNTDESTLEADPFSFSFYNRPIFLQEKRPFFSKDLDILRSNMNLFYTRAIENIEVGGNYTYRSDDLKFASVFVQEEPDAQGNREQFFIARPRFDGSNFTVGGAMIYTNNPSQNYQDKILSIDGNYRFTTNRFRFYGQFVRNFEGDGNAFTAGGFYQYNNQGGPFADWGITRVDKEFKSSTYFFGGLRNPNDFQDIFVSGGHNFVFNRPLFPEYSFSGGYSRLNAISDGFDYQNRFYANAFARINNIVSVSSYFEYNRPNDFDNQGNLITRTNTALEHNVSLVFGSNTVNFGYFYGPYFGSFIKNPYISANIILFERLGIRPSINYVDYFDIKQTIINTRVDYRIIKQLYFRGFFGKNTNTKEALLNLMMQYEFFAGSNIYLVMNLQGPELEYTRRYFKIGYEFSF
ncbi:MAG TPA: hypothetical protein PLG90_00345 [Ignavibacteria bacterium]|nr:hypothetical protein [Ignavibacteria bacterium]